MIRRASRRRARSCTEATAPRWRAWWCAADYTLIEDFTLNMMSLVGQQLALHLWTRLHDPAFLGSAALLDSHCCVPHPCPLCPPYEGTRVLQPLSLVWAVSGQRHEASSLCLLCSPCPVNVQVPLSAIKLCSARAAFGLQGIRAQAAPWFLAPHLPGCRTQPP